MSRNTAFRPAAGSLATFTSAVLVAMVLALPAEAQNLVDNPELDFGIGGWSVDAPSISDLDWNGFDATECEALSGSALATNFSSAASGSTYFTSCVSDIDAGETYSFGGLLRFVTGQAQTGYAKLLVRWMDEDDCDGNVSGLDDSDGVVTSATAGNWVASGYDAAVAPAGTRSAILGIWLVKDSNTGSLAVRFDSVFMVPRSGFLFADGFGNDSSCRWSEEVE